MTGTENHDDRPAKTAMWLEWAVAQIDATLEFDGEASSQLAVAVYGVLDDPRLMTRVDNTVPEHELSISAAMQQHDRLMQQMSHVSQALRSLIELLSTQPKEIDWDALRAAQLARFSMAEERALFHLMVCESPVPDRRTPVPACDDADAANSVELF